MRWWGVWWVCGGVRWWGVWWGEVSIYSWLLTGLNGTASCNGHSILGTRFMKKILKELRSYADCKHSEEMLN